MPRISALVLSLLVPLGASAQETGKEALNASETSIIQPAGESQLSEFHWIARPVIVFADSPQDPRFIEQIEYLSAEEDMLRERDVIVLTDTDPDARAPIRMQLRPRGFMLVLVDKDGNVELRKPMPWTVREITRSIDKMPNRQREIDERRQSN